MFDSLVGSKVVMMGLIFLPLMPPASLICLTKKLMAWFCSANSGSWANPSRPANELSDTTGKATLMLSFVTPRVEVLAVLTEEGEPLELPPDEEVDVLDELPLLQAAAPIRITLTAARARRRTGRLCHAGRPRDPITRLTAVMVLLPVVGYGAVGAVPRSRI